MNILRLKVNHLRMQIFTLLGLPGLVFSQSFTVTGIQIHANQSLPSYRYEDYDLERFESLARETARRLEDSRRTLDRRERDLDQAESRLQQVHQEIQKVGRQLEQNKKRESEIKRSLDEQQEILRQAEQILPRLQSEIASLQNQVQSTQQVISNLQDQLSKATSDEEKQNLSKQIETQNDILRNLNSQLNTKTQEQNQWASRGEKARQSLDQNRRELEKIISDTGRLENQISELQRKEESAQREVFEYQRARDSARNEYQALSREYESARRNVEIVRDNINRAARILTDSGTDQGAQDGEKEGYELGQSRGQYDGQTRGSSEGAQRGTADGQRRDYQRGYTEGQARATREATQASEKEALINGQRDGSARGKADGLLHAYEEGKKQGLQHGAETGSDREAYELGQREGQAAGLAKAVEDAKPQEPIGYTDKEREYLTAPLKSVVVGDNQLAEKFKGLQGRFSEEGDDRYYRPQPGVLPHPRLERFYVEAYDTAYRTHLSSTYRSVYRSNYESSYNQFYRARYDEAYNRNYPESHKEGDGTGYQETYQKVYDANYRVRYNEVYREFYAKLFAQFENDPTEKAKGFKDGNRIASKDKGFREGHAAAYAANLEIEKKKAYAAGQARAKNLYDNNPVIQIESLELQESDADGIHRPGENLVVVMKLKNFGLKAKLDLQSSLTESKGSLQVSQVVQNTGTIPAQSQALVIVPSQASVLSTAKDGESLEVLLKAQTGSTLFASQRVIHPVQYPAKVSLPGFEGILIPGQKTAIKIRVLNRSKKSQNLDLSVFVDTSKVDADLAQLTVSDLAPSSQRDVVVHLTGKMEARFEESPLEVQTQQKQIPFAMKNTSLLTIIRKHSPTADSKGLILSANLAQGSGKKLFALDKFDTWDLRVDGPVLSLQSLETYRSRVIHILADENSQIDSQTMSVLKQLVDKNGSLSVWGSRLDRSQMGQSLLKLAGVGLTSVQNFTGVAIGIERLKGLSLPLQGVISILNSQSPKANYVLNSSVGTLGLLTFGNAMEDRTGQILTVGMDLTDLSNESALQILSQFERVRLSTDSKIKLVMEKPSENINLLAHDLFDELVGAELLGSGSFYKNNSEKNKIFRAGKRLIGDAGRKSAQARELSKLYPALMNTISTRLSREKWFAEQVLEKRHGNFVNSRSIKDIFCENNPQNQLCQAPVN